MSFVALDASASRPEASRAPTAHAHHLPEECRVMSTGTYALAVQTAVGLTAAAGLYIKWRMEHKRKRPVAIFALDAAKLAVAGSFGHVMNMICAVLLTHISKTMEYAAAMKSAGDAVDGSTIAVPLLAPKDECAMYLLNYLVDLFLGVPLAWGMVWLVQYTAKRRRWSWLERRGYYGDPPRIDIWLLHTLVWMGILLVSKALLLLPVVQLQYSGTRRVDDFVEWVMPPIIARHPKFELAFVMVVVPAIANVVQILLFDEILMDHDSVPATTRGVELPVGRASGSSSAAIQLSPNSSPHQRVQRAGSSLLGVSKDRRMASSVGAEERSPLLGRP